MASPASVTLRNFSGRYFINKKLSDDADPILALQGVGWVKRKIIASTTFTVTIKQYIGENNLTCMDIDTALAGGIKGAPEQYRVDGAEALIDHDLFGKLKGKSEWIKVADVDDEYLKAEFNPEDEVIQVRAESVGNGWTARQIWGFANIGGIRYQVRRVVVTKGGKVQKGRLVYDYLP